MEDQLPTTRPDVNHLLVPEPLLEELKQADNRLHTARKEMEKTIDDSGFRHQERDGQTFDEVRKAEKDVELLSEKIRKIVEQKP